MNKIKVMNVGEGFRFELVFDSRKDAINYFSSYENMNDILEMLVYDYCPKPAAP